MFKKIVFAAMAAVGVALWMRNRQSSPRAASSSEQRRLWWQKILGAVAAAFLVLLILNPELLALGLVMDATFIDLFVLLFTLQLQMMGGQAWFHVQPACKKIAETVVNYLRGARLRLSLFPFCLGLALKESALAICAVAKQATKWRVPRDQALWC